MIHFYLHKTLKSRDSQFQLEIEWSLAPGKLLGIQGASGSGKTTILRCLAGLEKPELGFIKVKDQFWYSSDHKVWRDPQHRSQGLVFQDYALFPHLSVEKNLLYGHNDPARLKEILNLIRLEDRKSHYPQNLSGGQKQRVALGRALMRSPDLLLLDEPFSALDEELRQEVGEDLVRIQKETGVTGILVTHSKKEIQEYCDEVLYLKDGKILSGNYRV